MYKLILQIKRGLGLFLVARVRLRGGERLRMLIYSDRLVLPHRKFRNSFYYIRLSFAAYYQILAVSSYILRIETNRDVRDTFGHRPGLLFHRLAYFTRSLITINIRLFARFFVRIVYVLVPAQ